MMYQAVESLSTSGLFQCHSGNRSACHHSADVQSSSELQIAYCALTVRIKEKRRSSALQLICEHLPPQKQNWEDDFALYMQLRQGDCQTSTRTIFNGEKENSSNKMTTQYDSFVDSLQSKSTRHSSCVAQSSHNQRTSRDSSAVYLSYPNQYTFLSSLKAPRRCRSLGSTISMKFTRPQEKVAQMAQCWS